MSLTVVGSVALDTVETPMGKNIEGLGGSAVYFSLSAQHFTPVHLVGVVGEDFPQEHVELLGSRRINLDGLERVPGRTFRWSGRYHADVNFRDTLDTQLNVFESFHPKLPAAAQANQFLFLGNIHPALQMEVLNQTRHKFVALDSMNLWIEIALDDLKKVLAKVDCIILNDSEAKLLTGESNLRKAARAIRELGPGIIVIKKGEHGAMLFAEHNEVFSMPALPLEEVVDPTGAGDSFAGGFMGYLAHLGATDVGALRAAMVYGSACASHTCEAFGPDRLSEIERQHIDARVRQFRELTAF